ncbi:uncharacterized protein LOC136062862 [Quercus suber]|uniref:uncharacterized protein LOC136062862 n=1 Tax=Quercus suber TaxID=58331 RepID=UPI0032DEF020
MVMVKKANGKYRMCVDFTDLNKDCPKDSYPLPRVNQLMDSTAGHQLPSFMDAFSGYNQIKMDEVDQQKTSFITSQASRKLRHYFQAHIINVMTDHLLRKAMNKLEAAGQLIQLAIELCEFDISHDDLDGIEDVKTWVIHVDGSSTLHTKGIGVVLQSLEEDELKYKVRLQYPATNNEVEYEALLKGLELAKSLWAESIFVQGDSQLVMGQVNGKY